MYSDWWLKKLGDRKTVRYKLVFCFLLQRKTSIYHVIKIYKYLYKSLKFSKSRKD